MSQEKFTLFHAGPFSQWFRSPFVIDGVTYCNAEQYMMAEKARLFGDAEAEALIMSADHGYLHKQFGRTVRNFDVDKWNAAARDIVYCASKAKYTQNEDLKTYLLSTAGTTLVEANPNDRVWGIGLGTSSRFAHDRAKWKGTNWLGEILTKVRDEIIADN